ncbi:MAG TPA: hypothetical protein VHX44_11540 [Planctomycetota bacterium]|jgi:hypothetical protein|nr:hypothetical protein [Planctomycetota bacterium]
MMRQVFIFIAAAAIGALLALLLRSAWHQPYAEPSQMPAPGGQHDHQPPAAPASPLKPAVDPHAGHAAGTAQTPVNTICAICGMDVDPELPTTDFQGKVIGFACLKCPPKFSADPQRYGPASLRNEKAP